MLKLVIGNKNYSSWSLRAWLFLKESGIPFEEIRIPLYTGPSWRSELAQYTPAGRVPVIVDGDITVWDTLAIFEYLRESQPGAIGWPEERRARAQALAVAAEMHSGFLAVREELPQNVRARRKLALSDASEACRSQVARIDAIWSSCRRNFGDRGPWLFGPFSISDIMFAPVALRFVTYSIPLSRDARHFVDRVLELSSIREWARQSEAEPERLQFIDDLVPASETPLTPG